MNNAIYMSIKSKHMRKILKGDKNHEFRNYIPKKSFEYIYVYETKPIGEIKHILKIGNILTPEEKIKVQGDGNKEFNDGKKTKFAYEILEIIELENSISLKALKEKYGFVPPQAYAYDESYKELTEYIRNAEKKKYDK